MKDIRKNCRLCKKEKSIDRFSWRNDSKKYRTECKDCLNIAKRSQPRYGEWHKENPERVRELNKISSLRKYGLTIEDFNKLLLNQDKRCKICKTKNLNNHGQLCVDHCHETGKVRGLLCDICNRGLGYFKDDVKLIESAFNYLKDNK